MTKLTIRSVSQEILILYSFLQAVVLRTNSNDEGRHKIVSFLLWKCLIINIADEVTFCANTFSKTHNFELLLKHGIACWVWKQELQASLKVDIVATYFVTNNNLNFPAKFIIKYPPRSASQRTIKCDLCFLVIRLFIF